MTKPTFHTTITHHKTESGKLITIIVRDYKSFRETTPEEQAALMASAIVGYDPTHADSPGDSPLKFLPPKVAEPGGTPKSLVQPPDDQEWWERLAHLGEV